MMQIVCDLDSGVIRPSHLTGNPLIFIRSLSCDCICLQGSALVLTGIAGGATFLLRYSDDTTQLQFDTATKTGSLLRLLDAETAHKFGIWAAKYRLLPRDSRPDHPSLATSVWGRQFVNPLGEP